MLIFVAEGRVVWIEMQTSCSLYILYVHVLYMCLRCVHDVAFIDLAMVYVYMYSTFDS